MNPTEVLAQQILWAGRNMAYNLDFIADDKLDWKPEPTANSALEIVQHSVGAILMIEAAVVGARPDDVFVPATTRDEAKKQLIEVTENYAVTLRGISLDEFERDVELPFATLPLGRVIMLAVIDLIHHHGQIAYLQTLLGDTENHLQL